MREDPARPRVKNERSDGPPQLQLSRWRAPFDARDRGRLAAVVPGYLARCRWFGGKARTIQAASVLDTLALDGEGFLAVVRVDYVDGGDEIYLLAAATAGGQRARHIESRRPEAVIAPILPRGLLYDALVDRERCQALLELLRRRRRLRGTSGELRGKLTRAGRRHPALARARLAPRLLGAEQSNTSIVYGDKLILKLMRRLDEGPSPELEVGRFLTERCSFAHAPRLLGWLEYRGAAAPEAPNTLAVLQECVPNRGDAWRLTLEELQRYFARALAGGARPPAVEATSPVDLLEHAPSAALRELIGGYHEAAQLLGQRTAELHLALASDAGDSDFAPERGSTTRRWRALTASLRALAGRVLGLLDRRLPTLAEADRVLAERLLRSRGPQRQIAALGRRRITAPLIRCHGDLHLGQVLCTERDFVIIDFEGEPARPLAERRRKRAALCDVAGMLRSFHYAANSATRELGGRGVIGNRQRRRAQGWADAWQTWVSRAYLVGYLETTRGSLLAPSSKLELKVLLEAHLLEKALYELGYELNNRPAWVGIPLAGLLQLCER